MENGLIRSLTSCLIVTGEAVLLQFGIHETIPLSSIQAAAVRGLPRTRSRAVEKHLDEGSRYWAARAIELGCAEWKESAW
jgi:hypothetical protein